MGTANGRGAVEVRAPGAVTIGAEVDRCGAVPAAMGMAMRLGTGAATPTFGVRGAGVVAREDVMGVCAVRSGGAWYVMSGSHAWSVPVASSWNAVRFRSERSAGRHPRSSGRL